MIFELLLGFYIALIIAVIAWWRKALDASGAVAATIAGTVIFGVGGLGPSMALVAFFVSGSILSRLSHQGVNLPQAEIQGRTWKQVVANGLVPVIMIISGRVLPSKEPLFLISYYGAIATSCADTWGTEIGTRFGKNTRDVLTWQPIAAGLSGGVSFVGTVGSILGAAIIVLASVISIGGAFSNHIVVMMTAILIAGTLGSVSDSILGSSVQAKYRSSTTWLISEVPDRTVGSEKVESPMLGYKQITNNSVNLISSAIGAVFSVLIFGFN